MSVFRRVLIALTDRRRTPFPLKTAGPRLKERRGSAAIRIHATALQRPPPGRRVAAYSDPVGRAPASVADCVPCACGRRTGATAARLQASSFALSTSAATHTARCGLREALQLRHRDGGAHLYCFSLRSKGSPDAYSARTNEWLRATDTRIVQSAKAADRYDDVRYGGCVLMEATQTLRWPAKSEATSPAPLPAERKPVDGESFDSDPGQRDQGRRRRRTTLAARSLPARAG